MLTTAFPRYRGDFYINFVLDLSKSLTKKGLQIKVITPNDPKTKSLDVVGGIEVNRFTYMLPRRLQKVAYGNGILRNLDKSLLAKIELPFFFFFFFLKSLRHCRNYDIIHAHTSLPGFIGVFLKKITKRKLIVTLHGTEIDMLQGGILNKLTLWTLRNSDKIITVSNSLKQKVINMGISESKIGVVPDGVNISNFRYTQRNKNIDIVFVGRLSKEKGLPILVEAMNQLTKVFPALKLLIIGEGNERENLKRLVKNFGLEKNILFEGKVSYDQIPSMLQRSKILALPSLREGFGMVLLEAMASGTAVIGSNVGGIPDIIEDGKTGLLFKTGNSNDLAEKIIHLLKNPQVRQKLARNGRKTVEENFTWEKVAERTINAYENIL